MFEVDPRLTADTLPVGEWPLCRLRMMNDSRFPWLVLVPGRAGLREIFDLRGVERISLFSEIAAATEILAQATGADKMNVAALGNRVEQLHVHVIARFRNDCAWPNPVWGRGERTPYDLSAQTGRLAQWRRLFAKPPA